VSNGEAARDTKAPDPRALRLRSYAFAFAVLALVAWPITWKAGRDSFPLSSYPMFARARKARMQLTTVLGVREGGGTTTLSPELIADAHWVNLAARVVRDTVAKGPAATDALCRKVAARVAADRADVLELQIVTETFDVVAASADDAPPTSRKVLTTCPVRR